MNVMAAANDERSPRVSDKMRAVSIVEEMSGPAATRTASEFVGGEAIILWVELFETG